VKKLSYQTKLRFNMNLIILFVTELRKYIINMHTIKNVHDIFMSSRHH